MNEKVETKSDDLPIHSPINKKDKGKEKKRINPFEYRVNPKNEAEWFRLLRESMNQVNTLYNFHRVSLQSFVYQETKNGKWGEKKEEHATTLGQRYTALINNEDSKELLNLLIGLFNESEGKPFESHPGFKTIELLIDNYKVCFNKE